MHIRLSLIFCKKLLSALIGLLLSLWLLSIIIFVLSRLLPGSPLNALLGANADLLGELRREAALKDLGFDRPLYLQYLGWLGRLLQGDLGFSLYYKQPLSELLPPLLGNSLILGGLSYLLILILAPALALLCVRHEGRLVDRLICRIGSVCYFLPAFWLALILIMVISVNLQWLPGSGAYTAGAVPTAGDRLRHLILPVMVLVLSHVWYYGALLRGRLCLEVRQPYVLTARACGETPWRILLLICLKAAMPLWINLLAVSAAHIAGGTMVVEAVFNYPGLGLAAVIAAKNHDYELLMLITLLCGSLIIAAALAARGVTALIDPRFKTVGNKL